jgi:hypothetical protein
MDLLVLDNDATFGATMEATLVDVDVSVVHSWPQLRLKFEALAVNQLPIVVCSSEVDLGRCMEWNPRLLVIFWAQQLPSSVDVLRLMQMGVRDIWLPSESANDWAVRLQWLNKLNAMVNAISGDSQRDIQTARVIQQSMWPQDEAVLSGYKFSRRLLPAAMLSGDFVDYFAVGARYLIFFMADVAGHGVSPALLTAALKNISWRLQQRYGRPRFRTPAQMLEWINARVIDQSVDLHVAMFLGVIDLQTHTLHYASAAHFPPSLRVSDTGEVTSLEQRGKPLGLFAGATYESAEVDLRLGERVVVFSDGILEQRQTLDLATREQALKDQAVNADDIEGLWSYATANVSGEDDVSLLMVERLS